MLYQIFQYLKHLINSQNQHGIHSPFVYNLVTNCFYKKTPHQLPINTGINNKSAKLIYRVYNYFKPKHILEFGNPLGLSSFIMSIENPKANITYLNSNTNSLKFSEDIIKNIRVCVGDYNDEIKAFKPCEFDFLLCHLNNEIDQFLDAFEALLPIAHNDSVFIFNGLNDSRKMTKIWNSIKDHPKVTVSIDTYYLGFAFTRKEQAKEHFNIRV